MDTLEIYNTFGSTMSTLKIYNAFGSSMSTKFDDDLEFAIHIIDENDTPDHCQHCLFQFGSGAYFCGITDRDLDANNPQCTVYDFVKYVLERM